MGKIVFPKNTFGRRFKYPECRGFKCHRKRESQSEGESLCKKKGAFAARESRYRAKEMILIEAETLKVYSFEGINFIGPKV